MRKTDNFFVISNYNTDPSYLIDYCNDYIVYDHFTNEYAGVVAAVNEFLSENPQWTISAFVIGEVMHSDIYIKMI